MTCQKSGFPEIPQYRYLHNLKALALDQPIRNAALDYAYAIAPDIIKSREAFDDETINQTSRLVDEKAIASPFRKLNNNTPILLGSISCKCSLRSSCAKRPMHSI